MVKQETLKIVADKINDLRKAQGYTQDEVARLIGIPRTSYAQFEAGNRNLSTIELINLSKALEFSLPKFLSEVFGTKLDEEVVKPVFNYRKFKSVFLYILNACREKNNVGKVVLYKLLYFSDFNYYEKYHQFLTGATYSKLPMGPVPAVEHYINEMIENSEVKEKQVEYYNRWATRYIPQVKPDLKELSVKELEVINDVITRYSHMNATEISDLSHEDMPWLETESLYEEINYSLVFKRPENHNF